MDENQIEWDIDANLPMYTRDFLKMQGEPQFFVWLSYSDALHSVTENWARAHADTVMYKNDIFFAATMVEAI